MQKNGKNTKFFYKKFISAYLFLTSRESLYKMLI